MEAVIYCEAPVATTLHRAVACALDWSMVLLGYALFLLGFSLLGGQFELTKSNVTMFGAMFLMIGFTYGLLFAWAGTETPGMRLDAIAPDHVRRFPAGAQAAAGALLRLLSEPLHAARVAVVPGR